MVGSSLKPSSSESVADGLSVFSGLANGSYVDASAGVVAVESGVAAVGWVE